jgi:cholesterol transport system auxiliary component
MKKLLTLATIVILSGCGATSSYYILSDIKPQQTYKHMTSSIGVEKVEVPKYLFKRELAVATSDNKVTFDSSSEWAEDMDEALTRRVIGTLQKLYNNPNIYPYPWGVDKQPRYRLHINITRFIAKGSYVYIDANYRIEDTKTQRQHSYLYSNHILLKSKNPDMIVKTMDSAIEYLIQDIAKKI